MSDVKQCPTCGRRPSMRLGTYLEEHDGGFAEVESDECPDPRTEEQITQARAELATLRAERERYEKALRDAQQQLMAVAIGGPNFYESLRRAARKAVKDIDLALSPAPLPEKGTNANG